METFKEYWDGRDEKMLDDALKAAGFDCDSNKDEVLDFVLDSKFKFLKRLSFHDKEELVDEFFKDGHCTRGLLDRIFGRKRK